MITLDIVIGIHQVLIRKYGGITGVRDQSGLESAINRPYQTFGGEELYKTSVDKAAAVIESIVKNHPFMDGNKRTGYVLMQFVLIEDNKQVIVDENEKYDFVIRVAANEIDYESIRSWIQNRVV